MLVLADRGRWRHPRSALATGAAPPGDDYLPTDRARALVARPGRAEVRVGTACKARCLRRYGALIVLWEEGHHEAWGVLTDLPSTWGGLVWDGRRIWGS
jgi:hypothetical protein